MVTVFNSVDLRIAVLTPSTINKSLGIKSIRSSTVVMGSLVTTGFSGLTVAVVITVVFFSPVSTFSTSCLFASTLFLFVDPISIFAGFLVFVLVTLIVSSTGSPVLAFLTAFLLDLEETESSDVIVSVLAFLISLADTSTIPVDASFSITDTVSFSGSRIGVVSTVSSGDTASSTTFILIAALPSQLVFQTPSPSRGSFHITK